MYLAPNKPANAEKGKRVPRVGRALEPKWLSSSRAESIKNSVSTLDQYLGSSHVRNLKVTNKTDLRMETVPTREATESHKTFC